MRKTHEARKPRRGVQSDPGALHAAAKWITFVCFVYWPPLFSCRVLYVETYSSTYLSVLCLVETKN